MTFEPQEVIETLYKGLVLDKAPEDTSIRSLERIAPKDTISTAELNQVDQKATRDIYFQKGLELIRDGKVTTVILAGGQGSRLGSNDPKGMFNI